MSCWCLLLFWLSGYHRYLHSFPIHRFSYLLWFSFAVFSKTRPPSSYSYCFLPALLAYPRRHSLYLLWFSFAVFAKTRPPTLFTWWCGSAVLANTRQSKLFILWFFWPVFTKNRHTTLMTCRFRQEENTYAIKSQQERVWRIELEKKNRINKYTVIR